MVDRMERRRFGFETLDHRLASHPPSVAGSEFRPQARVRRENHNRSSRVVPVAQAALTRTVVTIVGIRHPPAIGSLFSGETTNQFTSVGARVPKRSAENQYRAAEYFSCITKVKTTPHKPPQKAVESIAGTPNGSIGAIAKAPLGVRPSSFRSVSMSWWNVIVARKPARKPAMTGPDLDIPILLA